ncbi:unnamed protein product [Vitrella brassicaformis CCMP3155]|uniref:Dolichyl-diphosphooligosaccharide--protein glycosyltransferase subunit 1 n=1 Tax=Vitrella brassicaformis (strain CCMP3155) TaxID=1169540 RepID=A0A0G4EWA3_VITBC|nr:unnamed protein product [Vitrella brassicaformis CCMP3155]|eukprot:CEM02738.1 unnamed protein product [Vitrella brassicaformis CCMP3155]
MRRLPLVCVIACGLAAGFASCDKAVGSDLVITTVERTIDTEKPVVSSVAAITFANEGAKGVSKFFWAVPKWQANFTGWILAEDERGMPLEATEYEMEGAESEEVVHYKVMMKRQIEPKKTAAIQVTMFLGNALVPLPRKINIDDEHEVVYSDLLYFFTPYRVKEQWLKIKTATKDIRSYKPKLKNSSSDVSKRTVSYGPFTKETPPYYTGEGDKQFVSVHCSMPKPLPILRRVVRDIEVSHWGNVFFHESFQLYNAAAGLKGEFSRIPFMTRRYPPHAIEKLTARIPYPLQGLHYYDHIGNISTSTVAISKNRTYVRLDLRPRYPILGGWNADWQLQYNVPSASVLFVNKTRPSQHVLNIPFSHPIKEVYAEEVITRIALPAGSHDIQIRFPREVQKQWKEVKWGWFDVFQGRPVYAFTSDRYYFTQTLQDRLEVTYEYGGFATYEKPLVIILFFFIPYALYILSGRFTLRILKEGEKEQLDRIEMQKTIISHLRDLYEDVSHVNDGLLTAAASYRSRPIKPHWEAAKASHEKNSTRIVTHMKEMIVNLPQPQQEKLEVFLKSVQEEVVKLANVKAADEAASPTSKKTTKGSESDTLERKIVDLENQFFNILESLEQKA